MTGARPALPHVAALDGLRGLAALTILLFHSSAIAPASLVPLFSMGWVGVDLFFVISGYLITTILLINQNTSNYYSIFYGRRALRIFPVYYVALILAFLVLPALAGHSWLLRHLGFHWIPWSAQALFWVNLSNLRTAFHPEIVPRLTHFWSLAIEEQFYAVWPLVIRNAKDKTIGWICVVGLALGLVARNLPQVQAAGVIYPDLLYRFTPFHVDGLLAGALLALVLLRGGRIKQHLKPLLQLLFLASAGALFWLRMPMWNGINGFTRLGYTAICLLFTAGIGLLLLSGERSRWNQLLSLPLLQRFGRVSYTFYVVHLTILYAVYIEFTERVRPFSSWHFGTQKMIIVVSITIVLSWLIALISWHTLEQPILKFKRHLKYKHALPTTVQAAVLR